MKADLFDQISLYMTAVRAGDIETVEALLDAGLPTEATRSNTGQTLLILMVRRSTPQLLRLLASRGANFRARDMGGHGVMMRAVQRCRPDLLPLLVELGADINEVSKMGMTPLHFAIRFHRDCPDLDVDTTVRALLAAGADADIKTNYRFTPREMAEEWGVSFE